MPQPLPGAREPLLPLQERGGRGYNVGIMARGKKDGRGKDSDKRDFETILVRLEEIVGLLEGGEKGLEESLGLFEEGVKLSREGHAILDRAETSVQTLLESGEEVEGVKEKD